MANTNRIGGVLSFMLDGVQYQARGNFTVTGMTLKRTPVAGQDGMHGYIEEPIAPEIKGDISIGNLLSLETLEGLNDVTAQVNLANGRSYVLTQAWTEGAFVLDAHDGKVGITMHGMSGQEI